MCTFIRNLSYFPQNVLQHATYYFRIFSGFYRGYSPECLATFPGIFGDIPGIFGDIPQNIWGHSPECLRTFPGMFGDIPRNVWGHSPECLATFPGMFEDIPRNVWRHSPEYNIPPIPRVPRIPFPVPVFLVLYIALTTDILHGLKLISAYIQFEKKITLRFLIF